MAAWGESVGVATIILDFTEALLANTPKKLLFALHRLESSGGQERSTLEVLTRLAARDWGIEVLSFTLADWPAALPLKWHRVPRGRNWPQLLQNIWFLCYSTAFFAWRRCKLLWRDHDPKAVTATIGTAALFADVRVVQFSNTVARRLYMSEVIPYPNAQRLRNRLYQAVFAKWEAGMERLFLRRCRLIITLSQRVRDDLQPLLLSVSISERPEVRVIHHGADSKAVDAGTTSRPLPPQSSSSTRPIILFVGALERKGIETALQTLALVADCQWQFVAVGGGSIERWKVLADELGIGERVTFVGAQPAKPYFLAADIFLFPSHYEPFGLVVSEAASYGLAILASQECGAMELWRDIPTWLKLRASSPPAIWALGLRRLLTSPQALRLASASAQAAFGLWTWDAVAEAYEIALNSLEGATT